MAVLIVRLTVFTDNKRIDILRAIADPGDRTDRAAVRAAAGVIGIVGIAAGTAILDRFVRHKINQLSPKISFAPRRRCLFFSAQEDSLTRIPKKYVFWRNFRKNRVEAKV